MALNQRYTEAKHIALTAPADIESGAPVQIGQFVGVAQTTATKGEKVTVWLDGSYDLTVDGAVTEGQLVNIKTDGTLTTGTGTPFGIAVVATAAAGTAEIAPLGKLQAKQSN